MNMMTGASSTSALYRLTITIIPQGDHYTQTYWGFSANNHNASDKPHLFQSEISEQKPS
jgi:hypothetical protein